MSRILICCSLRSIAHPFNRRSDTAHAEIFDFEIVLDAVLRSFAAGAALLDTAKWRNLGGDQPLVDADHAVFQRFGDAPHATDIATVEIGRKPEFRIVGEADRLRLGLKDEERRY